MKKLLFLLTIGLICSQSSFAQLQKGNFQLGGSAGIDRSRAEVSDGQISNMNHWNSLYLSPSVGYFFTENWVAGLNLRYNSSNSFSGLSSSQQMTSQYDSKSLGTGIFIRKYFSLHEKFALFGEFQSSIQRQTVNQTLQQNNSPRTSTEINRYIYNSLNAGVSFFPTKWLSVEAVLNPVSLSFSKRIDNNESFHNQRVNSSSLDLGLNSSAVYLGFNFFINRQ